MLVVVEKTAQEVVLEGEPLARGGEAGIYPLPGSADLLAKIYHRPSPAHGDKLAAMIADPPEDPMITRGHVSIAWPIDRIVAPGGQARCIGYLMRRVEKARPIIEFYNPRSRLQLCPHFHFGYLLRTARNLATAVRAIHERGHVIGDVNESNILTTIQALVTMVDTDSFQVRVGTRVHRCLVGKMEYTPPELQGSRFADVDRTPEHDVFGLAVLIFQLLMQGMHPFAGIYTGAGEPAGVGNRIAEGMWPYARTRAVPYFPNPHAPPFEVLPSAVQEMMRRCFEEGHLHPSLRPDALSWQRTLQEGEKELGSCSVNPQHVFPPGLPACPWCELARRHRRDPFPQRTAMPREGRVDGPSGSPAGDGLLEVLPADPVPIPPMPRTRLVEVTPVHLPEMLPVVEVFPVERSSAQANGERSAVSLYAPAQRGRTRLNTQKIDPALLPSPLPSNLIAWAITLTAGVVVVAVVLFFVVRKQILTGKEDRNVLRGHTQAVTCVVIAPEGHEALSGGNDGTVRFWHITREEQIGKVLQQGAPVRCVAFNPRDDHQVLSGGMDRKLRLWDLEQFTEVRVFEGHRDSVTCAAFTPDGMLAVSGSADQTLRVWEVKSGKELWRCEPLGTEIAGLAIARDGKMVICGCRDNVVRVWDLDPRGGMMLKKHDCTGHLDHVTAVAFSQDGKFFFSASYDETARMWDARTFREIHVFRGHNNVVEGLAVSPDGGRLLTASRDRTVRLWDTQTGQEIDSFTQHRDSVLCVAFSRDGAFSLSGGEDLVIRKWLLPATGK
jgi:WD40 repeat protein